MDDSRNSEDFQQAIFEECPNEPQDPYTLVPNALIRDESISPTCRWLIIFLLSNKPGWQIRISQIIKHVKGFVGRDKVYGFLNEAIEAGYIKREIIKRGNLKTATYYISKTARFKKSFRHPDCQDTEAQDPENQDDKNTYIDKNNYKKKEDMSEPAVGLTTFFFEKLKEINPKISKPNILQWSKQINYLLNTDKRSEDEVKQVINFIVEQHKNPKKDFTWSKAVQSPEKLRKHFAAIWLEMSSPNLTKSKEQEDLKKVNSIIQNKSWTINIFKSIEKKLSHRAELKFNIQDTYVGIGQAKMYQPIGYGEYGFREIIQNFLRKAGVL